MKDCAADDRAIEMAALYALGTLSQSDARAFENHLASGCERCLSELIAFEEVAANIGFAVDVEEPAEEIRELLLAQSGHSKSMMMERDLPEFLFVRSDEGQWNQIGEGILVKVLSMDEATGLATSLVRMSPGMRLEPHRHKGVEEFFILEGDCSVNGEALGPGDYHRASPGSIHQSTYTTQGTLFLLKAPPDYEFISTS